MEFLTKTSPVSVCRLLSRLMFVSMVLTCSTAAQNPPRPLGATYPYFGYGVLAHALPSDLPKGVLVSVGEIDVTASELNAEISKHTDSYGDQLRKYPIVQLGKMVADRLIAKEAKDWAKARGGTPEPSSAVRDYLAAKIPAPTVTEEEIAGFYRDHQPMFGGADFDSVKGVIETYVSDKKRAEATHRFVVASGERHKILISADWVAAQLKTWSSNPVEKVRASGKPSLVIFSVTGCCDKMEPVYHSIAGKYRDRLGTLFVDVREEKVLSQLYDAEEIPVIMAFDSSGKQVFRHNDYMLEVAVISQLEASGIDLN